jgi:hypothetical protein
MCVKYLKLPSWSPKLTMSQVVDLNMAQTYIPGFKCVGRLVVLVVLLIDWHKLVQYGNYPPIAMYLVVGTLLVTDRVLRVESIFDSNAIMLSIYIAYVLRYAREVAHFAMLLHGIELVLVNVIQLSYIAIGVLHLLDLHKMGLSDRCGCWLNVILFLLTTQCYTLADAAGELLFIGFTVIYSVCCICWIYAVGVNHMMLLLNTTTRIPLGAVVCDKNGKRGTGFVIIQAFTPCFLRFGSILYTTGWCQMVAAAASVITLIYVVASNLQSIEVTPHTEYTIPEFTTHESVPQIIIQQDAFAGASLCVGGMSFTQTVLDGQTPITKAVTYREESTIVKKHEAITARKSESPVSETTLDNNADMEMFRRAKQESNVI